MHYSLKVIDKPASEPVTVAEAKLHLRVHIDDDDDLIEALIAAAREYCENIQNRAYIERTYLLTFDKIPPFPIALPMPPLSSVEKIEYKKRDGTTVEWDATNYFVDTDSTPGRIVVAPDGELPTDALYPVNAFQVTYKAGAAASDVNERVKAAIKLLIGHWYENREAYVIGEVVNELEMAVKSLLYQDRMWPV